MNKIDIDLDRTIQSFKKIINAGIDEITITNDNFIIIDSWNTVEKIESLMNDKIDNIFDEWGFSDEYTSCYECNKSIHTMSYGKPQYTILNECDIVCKECITKNHKDEYINELINNPKKANVLLSIDDIKNHGFTQCHCEDNQICSFIEHGLREKTYNPEKILKNAIEKNPNKEFIFDITNIDMFEIDFTLYSRTK